MSSASHPSLELPTARPHPTVGPLDAVHTGKPDHRARPRPWYKVGWSLGFIGFLVYIFATTTYKYPLGNIGMIAALIGVFFERGRLRFPTLLIGFAAFIVWCAVVSPYSFSPTDTQNALIDLGKIWLITFVAVNVLRSAPRLYFFLLFWAACFALFPIRGALFNYFIAGYTVFGRALWNYIYSNPNDLAALCLLQLAIVAAALVGEQRRLFKIALFTSGALILLVTLLTQSRGAFIALGAVILIGITAQRRRLRAAAIVVIAGGITALAAPQKVWTRIIGLSKVNGVDDLKDADPEGSAQGRYAIWTVATTIIQEHPWTGIGLGAYPRAHLLYARRRADLPEAAQGARDTHSTYLNLFAEVGAAGLVLFMVFAVATAFGAERIRRRLRRRLPHRAQQLLYLELGLLAFALAAIFGSFDRLSFLYLLLAVLTAAADLGRRELRAVRTAVVR